MEFEGAGHQQRKVLHLTMMTFYAHYGPSSALDLEMLSLQMQPDCVKREFKLKELVCSGPEKVEITLERPA